MTLIDLPTSTARLLVTLERHGSDPGLAHHLSVHGPAPLPDNAKRDWSQQFIDLIARSGLKGRGGASFPTATKMASVCASSSKTTMVVNAMEGEPASQKDRLLATVAPHLVLEGAELVATAIGAKQIRLCVARSHRAAAQAWQRAVEERRASQVALRPTSIVAPPARYVGGEESALVQWLNGGDVRPTFRPRRPSLLTIGKDVTLVQNAETMAHVALIARYGAAWFRSVGTEHSPGTALITISGAVGAPGVYETPFGIPLTALLDRAGLESEPAGVILGGYGGSWIPLSALDTPFAPETLAAHGCTVGAGVVAVLPEGSCGLAESARIARWLASESAGQCGPCVFGLPAVASDLEQLAHEGHDQSTVDRIVERLGLIEGRGACRHPDGAVRFIRSALTAFRADVAFHLLHGPCDGADRSPTLTLPPTERHLPWR